MNLINLRPSPEEKRCAFQLDQWKNVPTDSGCYCLSTFEGTVLYIGQSVSLVRRFEEHLEDPSKTNQTPEGKAFWFNWYKYPTIDLNSLERAWININVVTDGKRPILNKIEPPT